MFLLKVLDCHNKSIFVNAKWPVPHADGTPTAWRRLVANNVQKPIRLCHRGYHGWKSTRFYTQCNGVESGNRLYLMEVRGTLDQDIEKVAASEARLVKYIGYIIYQRDTIDGATYALVTPQGHQYLMNYAINEINPYVDFIINRANDEGNP